ncbi:MAG: NAD(P)/FAD-dependent oxidoreductase [Clostridia bacterium]
MYDIAIIGGGIVGAACAYALSQYDLSILMIEKENDIAVGETRANSAIIHAGFDPEPGTRMAALNVRGNAMAERLCSDLCVPYRRIGALVLAFTETDRQTLKELCRRGKENGVPDIRILDRDEIRAMEPEASEAVMEALYAPSSGIVNPWEYAIAMAEVAVQNGAHIALESEVGKIDRQEAYFTMYTTSGNYNSKYVINAAGIGSANIHNMVAAPTFQMRPSRGEYYLLDKCEGTRVKHTLFHCPNQSGKGVLVSPTVHGNLIAGPNAVLTKEPLRPKTTVEGLAFVKEQALQSVPGIDFRNSIRNFAGIRANTDRDDFIIAWAEARFLDVAGIKSPGLSAAPAIAEEVIRMLENDGLELRKRTGAVTKREKVRMKELSAAQWNREIRNNPLYGRIICRCETITEGEIVDAIHAPIPARTVDGVKRRANAGMGRCQGGFCSSRILEILAREQNR